MRVCLSTKLPIAADAAFLVLRTPALLNHVAAPLLRFVPIEPRAFPPIWQEGACRVRVLLGGILPLGQQSIDISQQRSLDGSFRMRDNGSGDLARRWDHWITITPDGEDGCTYVDDVAIEAGLLTPVVWSFARIFYAHRQRRWRKLAQHGGAGIRDLMRRTAWRGCLDAELLAFASARTPGDVSRQWHALERAHILSQAALGAHLQVHRMMFGLAVRTGDLREIVGQAFRLALAPLGSLTGRIPWGNTGRARVDAFTPMPIPPDFRDVLPS